MIQQRYIVTLNWQIDEVIPMLDQPIQWLLFGMTDNTGRQAIAEKKIGVGM